MEPHWTLPELVAEVAARIAALPAPRNGQVRAVPDDRTVRYYATLGLLDRPSVMRGRTALYGIKHVAQVVAIKRLQTMGRSLSEIQALWPTLDSATLARMSGIELPHAPRPSRAGFWKQPPAPAAAAELASAADAAPRSRDGDAVSSAPEVAPAPGAAVELRVELAPGVILSLSIADGVAISTADVHALRAASHPLLTELASRRLAAIPPDVEPVHPTLAGPPVRGDNV